jgi:hypothetical protein
MFEQLVASCPQLQNDRTSNWTFLLDKKCDVENNLSMGCSENLLKDFKTYDVMQNGKYNVAIGKVIAPIEVFTDRFGIDKVVLEQ